MIKSVVFSGYYGMQNLGDDAFCVTSAWGAGRFWNASKIDFLSRTLPVMPCQANTLLFPKTLFKGQLLLEAPLALFGKSTIILAGGSLFQRKLNWLRSFLKLKNKLELINLGAIGVSIGPFLDNRAEQETKEFLKHFSFLVLRDKKSFDYASSINLPYNPIEGRDLAFLLPRIYSPVPHKPKRHILGISLCHYEQYVNGDLQKEMRREKQLIETLHRLAQDYQDGLDFRFFIFNGHPKYNDYKVTQQAISRLPKHSKVEIIDYSRDIQSIVQKLCECQAFLSTRLHGGIFAAAFHVPFMLVEYHQKCTDFLDDLGVPSYSRIGDMNCGVEEATQRVTSLIENCSPYDTVSTMLRAERNFVGIF